MGSLASNGKRSFLKILQKNLTVNITNLSLPSFVDIEKWCLALSITYLEELKYSTPTISYTMSKANLDLFTCQLRYKSLLAPSRIWF